jgi:hypothetical protein
MNVVVDGRVDLLVQPNYCCKLVALGYQHVAKGLPSPEGKFTSIYTHLHKFSQNYLPNLLPNKKDPYC